MRLVLYEIDSNYLIPIADEASPYKSVHVQHGHVSHVAMHFHRRLAIPSAIGVPLQRGPRVAAAMVVKTTMKVKRTGRTFHGTLQGAIKADNMDGSPEVGIEYSVPLHRGDAVEVLDSQDSGLIGPAVLVTRGNTEWHVSAGHWLDSTDIELHITVTTDSRRGG